MHFSRWLAILLASGTVAAASQTAPGGLPRNDYRLVLDHRAGPYRYLDTFKRGKPGAYEAAITAFGDPTRFSGNSNFNFCRVTWAAAGITIGFASAPPGCSTGNLFRSAWYGMSLHGSRWHNRYGIRVGDSIQKVRRYYPRARFDNQAGRLWLVLVRRQQDEFDFIVLAVAVNRSGRVSSIEVPAGYIY